MRVHRYHCNIHVPSWGPVFQVPVAAATGTGIAILPCQFGRMHGYRYVYCNTKEYYNSCYGHIMFIAILQ